MNPKKRYKMKKTIGKREPRLKDVKFQRIRGGWKDGQPQINFEASVREDWEQPFKVNIENSWFPDWSEWNGWYKVVSWTYHGGSTIDLTAEKVSEKEAEELEKREEEPSTLE